MEILDITSKIGDSVSLVVQKIISWLSTFGVDISFNQSSGLTVLILGIGIYLVAVLVDKGRKILKWGLIALFAILIISILISIFV